MKKRILSMLLALTMLMGIFTGCGAGGSAKEITVSEMLNSIIEEKGEVAIYKAKANQFDEDVATLDIVATYIYDGETLTDADKTVQSSKIKEFYIVEDENGNVRYEELISKLGDYVGFGAFSREEINGKSYMVFALYRHRYDGTKWWEDGVFYTLVEDTEYTIDKTVIFDNESEDIAAHADNATNQIKTWEKKFPNE